MRSVERNCLREIRGRKMEMLERITTYLKDNELKLATAESCTAGLVTSELARVAGSGACLDCGLAVYSAESKHRYLNVSFDTITQHGLTSEAVALEMALGALERNDANVAVANTGVAGPGSADDGTPEGRVCFAWVFRCDDTVYSYSETRTFDGERNTVRLSAAHYCLEQIAVYHQRALAAHAGRPEHS